MNTGEPLASAAPEHPPLPPGLTPLEPTDPPRIGPYPLVGRIGAGGMGAVYGALDVYGRCVAVKTVHADLAERPGFREAFAREVAMLARAQGVSTARLHAHDTEAEVPWLAFDFVPGRDLRAHVREFGPLTGEMLQVFALGMAEGLAALHAAGVAHRDIKPGNVILSPQGPKIVDFGIAVEIGTERSRDAAASYGTPGWAAPNVTTVPSPILRPTCSPGVGWWPWPPPATNPSAGERPRSGSGACARVSTRSAGSPTACADWSNPRWRWTRLGDRAPFR